MKVNAISRKAYELAINNLNQYLNLTGGASSRREMSKAIGIPTRKLYEMLQGRSLTAFLNYYEVILDFLKLKKLEDLIAFREDGIDSQDPQKAITETAFNYIHKTAGGLTPVLEKTKEKEEIVYFVNTEITTVRKKAQQFLVAFTDVNFFKAWVALTDDGNYNIAIGKTFIPQHGRITAPDHVKIAGLIKKELVSL